MSTPRKRLVIFESCIGRGGARHSLLSWLELLRDDGGFELKLLCGSEGWFTEQLKQRGFTYDVLPLPEALGAIRHGEWKNRGRTLLRMLGMTGGLLRAWWRVAFMRADGVLLTGGRDFIMLFPLVLRLRRHTATVPQTTDWGRIPTCKLMCRLVAHTYAISESVADSITEMGIPRAKVKVLPLIFTNAIAAALPDKAEARRRLGIAETDLVIALTGVLREQKGQREAITIFARVRQEVPHARLLIIGAPFPGPSGTADYERALHAQAKDLGVESAVNFLGWRDDVPAVLKAADVLFVPSLDNEGVPRVILEGLERSLPIVATNMVQFREILGRHNAGILCDIKDLESWIAATIALLKDDARREAAARHARAVWEAHYSREAARPLLLQAFRAICR